MARSGFVRQSPSQCHPCSLACDRGHRGRPYFGLLVLGTMIVGVLWLEEYVRDQFVSALQISSQVDRGRRGWTGDQVDSLLKDTLLVFGPLAILLAPMALALAIAETRPGRCRLETPHLYLLYRRCMVPFLRRQLRSAHSVCGLASSVGMRAGHANELHSTPCVIRDA